MIFKKLLSRTLKTISIVGASSVILQFSFINPSVAMDEFQESIDELSSSSRRPAFFEYDFTHLAAAQKLIAEAKFLPEPICLFFKRSAKTYDRRQFLSLLNPEGEKVFLSSFMPSFEEHKVKEPSTILMENMEDLPPEVAAAFEEFQKIAALESSVNHLKQRHEQYLKERYTPFIKNIEHEIEMKGPLNHQLFDNFFAHLRGIGKLWWVMTEDTFDIVVEDQGKYIYPQELVTDLLQKLKDIGFLKNFNKDNTSSVEEFYSVSQQFDRFHKHNKEEIKQLWIAGGHLGIKGIESIGKCRNALTIDLSPLELPDIIADINDKELLKILVECYEGKLDCIVDTSCCGFVFDVKESAPYILRLLRPGGRLLCRRPTGAEHVDSYLVDIYTQQYGLKPIYSDNLNDFLGSRVTALEKQ